MTVMVFGYIIILPVFFINDIYLYIQDVKEQAPHDTEKHPY